MKIVRYHTKTGSIYEVDRDKNQLRQVVRSDKCTSGRVGTGDWRPFVSAEIVHGCLHIIWGTGRDEHSEGADQVGFPESGREVFDASVTRQTHTSPVVKSELVYEA